MNRVDWIVVRRVMGSVGLSIAVLYGLVLLAESLNMGQFQRLSAAGGPPMAIAGIVLVVASALLELSTLVADTAKAKHYRSKADAMLTSLSSKRYQSREVNHAFLLHSTGHKPNGGEIDASIIYADYYYIEALLRQRALQEGGKRS